MNAAPPVLAVKDVADMLQCSPKTVQEEARTGRLPGLKLGTDWVFPAGALYRRLDELALEQASQRAQPVQTSAVLVPIDGKAKPKRQPPALTSTAPPDPRP